MADKTDIARCIEALQAVSLINEAHGPSVKAGELIRGIADSLALYRSKSGVHGGLCVQVSAAIYRVFLNVEPQVGRIP